MERILKNSKTLRINKNEYEIKIEFHSISSLIQLKIPTLENSSERL
jgi:hypothetical protein